MARRAIRAGGYEFCYVPGVTPGFSYLRMGNPSAPPEREFMGAIDSDRAIRRLRDYLTAMLKTARK